jgi:hypothetical protein
MPRPAWRLRAALVLAGLACAAATWRMAELQPFVQLAAYRAAKNDRFEDWHVVARARGGETIAEVSIEPLSGPVTVLYGASKGPEAKYDVDVGGTP